MKPKKMWKGGVKTEGVWIGCDGVPRTRHSIGVVHGPAGDTSMAEDGGSRTDAEADVGHEEDEMIWWAWDGKLLGFSEW